MKNPSWLLAAVVATLALAAVVAGDIVWVECPVDTVGTGSTSSSRRSSSLGARFGSFVPTGDSFLDDLQRRIDELDEKVNEAPWNPRAKRDNYPDGAKCASVQVPLDHHNESDPRTITVFAKCYVTSASSTGQLWMLQGGPGDSSSTLEPIMKMVASKYGDSVDVCTMDHRGVDRSSALTCTASQAVTPGSSSGCSVDESEATACSNELYSNVDETTFSSDQASHDLAYLIQNYSPSKARKVVYGVSYGTLWVTRFVQNYPSLATGVIFDSVVSSYGPRLTTFDKWDVIGDGVLKKYFALCDADAFCSSKLTGGATAYATAVLDDLYTEETLCPNVLAAFPTRTSLVALLNRLLQSNSLRFLIPALLYRIRRCRSDDVELVTFLAGSDTFSPTPCNPRHNQLLYNYVAFSEIFDSTLTLNQLNTRNNALTFSAGISSALFSMRTKWSTFFNNDLYNKIISPETRVLVLGGELDCQTAIEDTESFVDNLNITASFLKFGKAKNGNHAVILETAADGSACGVDIVGKFASNPSATLSLTCLNSLLHYDFQGNDLLNMLLIGTTDLYDGRAQIQVPMYPQSVYIAMIILAVVVALMTLAGSVSLALYCANKKNGTV